MTEIAFPISIALVGAPGSGKQAIADEFAKISGEFFAENKSELRVLENSGNLLNDKLDTAMGVFGGYVEDLRAYFLQYESERQAEREGASYVTLGTALESLAHSGVTLEGLITGLQTPDVALRAQQQQVAMTLLTFCFMERFRYTFGFYVPPKAAGLIVAGQDDENRTYNQRIDTALRTIFNNFGFRVQMLDKPTVEEQAQEMFDTIKRIVENGPDPLPEEAVRPEGLVLPPDAESTLNE